MKSLRLIIGAWLMVASVAAFAQTPGAGITGTKHDWSSASGQKLLLWETGKLNTDGSKVTSTDNRYGTPYMVTNPTTGAVSQGTLATQIGLCTKCHTPHQAKSQNLLWNHTLSTVTYKWDDPKTTAGTDYAQFKGDTYKGPTTKCLSCHDGLLASTDGMWFNRGLTSAAKYVAAPGSLDSGHEVAIGANMSKSHPVAMPYPLGGVTNTYNFVANGAQIAQTEWVANPMETNKIRLYQDIGSGSVIAGTNAGKTGIECSSCHDVHNGARVKDVYLLTGKLAGSDTSPGGYICTQCHKK